MKDHPVFEEFDLARPVVTDDMHINIVGCKTKRSFERPLGNPNYPNMLSSGAAVDRTSDGQLHLPDRESEDYYEWIDLLTAISKASDRFVMLELGAGYGRWIVNGALAAKRIRNRKPVDVFVCGVEMQDLQFQWMKEHVSANGIPESGALLFHGGISDSGMYELTRVQGQVEYGSSLAQISGDVLRKYVEEGVHFLRIGDAGDVYQIVKVVPISEIIEKVAGLAGVIDIAHIDIQTAELRAISASIGPINRQIKRMHIGTHSREIEDGLIPLLESNGWVVERFYPTQSVVQAEFGRLATLDGIISCRNARFD